VKGDIGAASTTSFTDAIIKNLGKSFDAGEKHTYKPIQLPQVSKDPAPLKPKDRAVKGIDVFIELDKPFEVLGKNLEQLAVSTPFEFKILSCRGVKIYPCLSLKEPDLVDHVCARFLLKDSVHQASDEIILDLLQKLSKECHWVHLEKLNTFDGKVGYSKTHGEG
jgi:hypothetical protein